MVHQIDVGGIAPGSTAVYATEIYQEGLRIPVVKMYEEGRPNETFFRIMKLNTRIPDKQAGDMRAQIAACSTAERGFRALVERHGSEAFRGMIEDLPTTTPRSSPAPRSRRCPTGPGASPTISTAWATSLRRSRSRRQSRLQGTP